MCPCGSDPPDGGCQGASVREANGEVVKAWVAVSAGRTRQDLPAGVEGQVMVVIAEGEEGMLGLADDNPHAKGIGVVVHATPEVGHAEMHVANVGLDRGPHVDGHRFLVGFHLATSTAKVRRE